MTFSENVAVTTKAPPTGPATADRTTLGGDRSAIRDSCAAAVFWFPAASTAALPPTSTVTAPSREGVTVNE